MQCDTQTIDNLTLAEMARTCACFNFRKATRSVTQLFDQILAPTGLRSTQLVILISSELLGPSSIARLARELVMDRSTLTRNLKPLLAMGMLQLSRAGSGKQKSVQLTPLGRAALAKATPYWEQAQSHLVSQLGIDRWERTMNDLADIVEATRSSGL